MYLLTMAELANGGYLFPQTFKEKLGNIRTQTIIDNTCAGIFSNCHWLADLQRLDVESCGYRR